MGTKALAHLLALMIARPGLNDLHNASEKPHRRLWKEVPLYDVGQPLRASLKILI